MASSPCTTTTVTRGSRTASRTLGRGVWASSVLRLHATDRLPGLDHDRSRSEFSQLRRGLGPDSGFARRPSHRRPPVRLSARGQHPKPVSGVHRADPDGLGARREGGLGSVPCDAVLARPLLHGRGLPAARDEKRRPVRAAVWDDVVRERPCVRRDPALGPARDRSRETTSQTPGSCTGYSRSPSPSPS